MLAIYKKELHSYFTSVLGWVFIAFFLVMTGLYFVLYNLINGIHAANNRDLCTVAAREEWGFEGVIMSDWNTTVPEDGSIPWKCTAAGNDIIMPGNLKDEENIRRALERGDLIEEDVRSCAGRVLRLIEKYEP